MIDAAIIYFFLVENVPLGSTRNHKSSTMSFRPNPKMFLSRSLQLTQRRMLSTFIKRYPMNKARISTIRNRNTYYRHFSSQNKHSKSTDNASSQSSSRNTALYLSALVVGVVGAGYAIVPLYAAFCQATGFGGETIRSTIDDFKAIKPRDTDRLFKVTFNSDIPLTMPCIFLKSLKFLK